MCKLESKTKEIVAGYEELVSEMMKGFGVDALLSMNNEEFDFTKRAMRLTKDAMELMVMQAKTLDEMNEKLDKVVKALEKKS